VNIVYKLFANRLTGAYQAPRGGARRSLVDGIQKFNPVADTRFKVVGAHAKQVGLAPQDYATATHGAEHRFLNRVHRAASDMSNPGTTSTHQQKKQSVYELPIQRRSAMQDNE
jgi:hypothetical protein